MLVIKGGRMENRMKEIENRRSIRKFRSQKIEREIIDNILKAGIDAPSAKNRQPWKFVVLEGNAKKQFSEIMKQGIQEERSRQLLPNSSKYLAAANHTAQIIDQAPVLLLIYNPQGKSLYEDLSIENKIYERADIQSVGAAIQNIILEATSLGIGSLWICDIYFAYDRLSKYHKEYGELLAAVALGYPDENPTKRPRNAFKDVVSYLK